MDNEVISVGVNEKARALMVSETVMFNMKPLRQAIAMKGWRQGDVAEATGFSDGTISKVLNGLNSSAKTVKQIADVVGVDMKDLVDMVESTQ